MPATIRNSVLLGTLGQHMRGKTKVSVNFTFTEDIIKIQSSNEYIYDTFISGDYTQDMINEPFSVMITNALQLLSAGEGLTTITKTGDVVVFDQQSISIPFSVTPDERIDMEWNAVESLGKVSISDLTSIASGFRNLVNVSKALEVGIPPVIIASGKVYCNYSNVIFIGAAPINIPDIDIPYNTFNNLSKSLKGSHVMLMADYVKRLLLLQVGNESAATTPYKKPNLEMVIAIEKRLSECQYIGTYDISSFLTLELLYKCFPKESVTLTAYEDNTIGVMFSLPTGKSIRAGTKDLIANCNIIISTTQFDAIYKTFKDTSKVEVFQSRDLVCFKSTVSPKQLIVSGMTF